MLHAQATLIRDYKKEDKSHFLEIFKSNCPLYFTREEFAPFDAYLENLGNAPIYANSEKDLYYVIEHEGMVVGCGGFYKIKDENTVRFAWGMIHNDCHNMSFGTALHKYRIDRINELYPGSLITLGTSQHTFGFFEKMGFKVTGITRDGYGEGMDDHEMEYISGL